MLNEDNIQQRELTTVLITEVKAIMYQKKKKTEVEAIDVDDNMQ